MVVEEPADQEVLVEETATETPTRRSRRWWTRSPRTWRRSSPPTAPRPVRRPGDGGGRRRRDRARRGRPARGVPPRAVGQRGRLVRRAHLLRHGEPGEVEPREPHRLLEHGGLHPRDRGPHRGHRRDQERSAPHPQEACAPRLRAGPHGPHRRVLVGGAPHAVGHRLRGQQPPARAAEPRRGRADARPRRHGRRRGARPPRPAAASPAAAPPPRSRSRSPTSASPTP